MKYDSQFIIYFSGADRVAEENAESLVAKAALEGVIDKTTCVELAEPSSATTTYNFAEYKPLVKGKVRVYVVGHGDDTSSTVGGLKAKALATTLDSMTDIFLTRVSLVACHAGGDGSRTAPHRFVSDFWTHAKHFVTEVTGYTGAVHTSLTRYNITNNPADRPAGTARYQSWSGKEWWVAKGTGKKTVSREHDEGKNRRKIYITKEGMNAKGWSPVLNGD